LSRRREFARNSKALVRLDDDGKVRLIGLDFNGYGKTLNLSADDSRLLVLQAQSMPNVWIAPVGRSAPGKAGTFGSRRDGWLSLDWMPNGKLVLERRTKAVNRSGR
jgi:hypothetical protein